MIVKKSSKHNFPTFQRYVGQMKYVQVVHVCQMEEKDGQNQLVVEAIGVG